MRIFKSTYIFSRTKSHTQTLSLSLRIGEERLRQEYQRLVEGLRRAREERENDMQLANPGNQRHNTITTTSMKYYIYIIANNF